MKLTLQNFRCFKQLSLTLPDSGIVLLWGTSGIGKTTIFKAIHFVLYGKEQKVVSFGEKKCKVSLDITIHSTVYTITRTRSPNYLCISFNEQLLENDVAQQKINDLFGRDFLLTSYMPQKGTESFFNLSNNEKTSFLQNLSLKDFDVESIRKKIRELLRQRKDQLIAKQTELSILEKQSKEYDYILAPPKLKLDLKGKTLEEVKEDDASLKEKIKKFIKEKSASILSLQKELNTLYSLQKEYDISQSKLEDKTLQLSNLQLKKDKIVLLSEEDIERINNELADHHDLLFANQVQRKLNYCKEEFQKLITSEEERKQKEIEQIQKDIQSVSSHIITDSSLLDTYNRLYQSVNEIQVILRDVKLSCSDSEELKEVEDILTENIEEFKESLQEYSNWKYQTQYDTYKSELQTIEQNIAQLSELITKGTADGYKCPKCSVSFYIDNRCVKTLHNDPKMLRVELTKLKEDKQKKYAVVESLEAEKASFRKKEETLKTKVIKLQTILNSFLKIYNPIRHIVVDLPFDECFIKLKQHKEYIGQYDLLQNKLNRISQTKILEQKIIQQKQQQIRALEDELKGYILPDEDFNEDYITLQIDKCKEQLSAHKLNLGLTSQLERDIQMIQKEILNIKSLSDHTLTIHEKERDIQMIQTQIQTKQVNLEKLELRTQRIQTYESELNEYTSQQSIIENLKSCKAEETLLLRGISKAELLLRRVSDAESLSLQQTIDRINHDSEEYISAFFDDTCSAHLTTFKETKDKDKKALIDIEFSRNGESISIDSLSGGEYDRLALALFLSFGSQSNVIMLDECLASLHSELVEEIIEKIKQKLGHRLVLFTLHQANTGIFDHIIDVEQLVSCC